MVLEWLFNIACTEGYSTAVNRFKFSYRAGVYPAGTGLAPGLKATMQLQTCDHLFTTKYGCRMQQKVQKQKKKIKKSEIRNILDT